MGPETDAEIQREFTELFQRTCELTGDIFALAKEEDILAEVNRRLGLLAAGARAVSSGHLRIACVAVSAVRPPAACERARTRHVLGKLRSTRLSAPARAAERGRRLSVS